jgi:hypothetical protein
MISTEFIKRFVDSLSPKISDLINHSFSNGVFPDFLKISKVTPIYIGGDKLDNYNYNYP